MKVLKFFVSDRDGTEPMVTIAEDKVDAASRWAERTGRKQSEAVVNEIGTRHKVKAREIKPGVAPAKEQKQKSQQEGS